MKKIRYIPYGYTMRNGRTVIAQDEATVIREIFSAYINGASLQSIAELLHHHQLGVQICNVPADLPCGRVFLLSLQLGGFQAEQSLTQDVVFREPKLIDHGDEGIVDSLLAIVV